MTAKKPRAEDAAAAHLFNSQSHTVLCIDFDDLAKEFGKAAANRMLDVLVPAAEPPPKDWILETWAARGSVGVVLAGGDPLYTVSQLAGIAVAIGYGKSWDGVKPTGSGPALFVTSIGNAAFVNLALTARRNSVGAHARRMRLAVLGVETLAAFDGLPRLTNNWRDLLDQMDATKPLLVIVDGRNGVLAGDSPNAVRWFGTIVHVLARMRQCAVLLLVDGEGEEDMDGWGGCGDFRFAFSGQANSEALRAELAAAVARGELPSMPR
jgi:hypothetical protein